MASDLILPSESPASIIYASAPSSSSSSATAAADDGGFEDGCSICLEPFSSNDPPTVTKCKHEYHLQCILEWSQRSKDCPICSRQVFLEDAASQELLAAVENERNARSRCSVRFAPEIHESNNLDEEDSEFEERILRQFAALTSRARSINRRIRQTSSGVGPAQVLPSAPVAAGSIMHQISDSSEESQSPVNEIFGSGLPPSGISSSTVGPPSSLSVFPSISNVSPTTAACGDSSVKLSESPPENPQRSSSSELHAFSESIKYKLSAASARYKETFSKNTRGFKEKLLARNTTVKEFGKEVQREMSAGIAGVARMIERLDLSSKRGSASGPLSSDTVGTSSFAHSGKSVQGSVNPHFHDENKRESASERSSNVTPLICTTIPDQTEVSVQQGRN
ncbi:PREDICTED: E3 ubiquitin-protein ligase RHF1A-like isoform X2 [Ipomoea nil]|uniref:E3 ubiquitin-protein ligase RHF1A-like isoform X2 n=1 Tax=Ipomoea nil TaxID=35883 RepID=UPI000901A0E4|nr:PREDICTED: E3 ubiquitin-protein ligase RHF1A-like isoform X2 [Ipomoea nil]